jgi:molybdopterin/thiamine biosynthesis adenylyltransferase
VAGSGIHERTQSRHRVVRILTEIVKTRMQRQMSKPRVKSVFPPIPVGDRIIRIGGVDYGSAAVITDDEQENTWYLLGLLDGTRTEAEIVSALQQRNPAVGSEDVLESIRALDEGGYLDDAAVDPAGDAFSPIEVQRYLRNFGFFSYFNMPPLTQYDLQERLKRARVTLLGLGGLGSFVALSLASVGVGDLEIVDFDTVDLSNLNRQVLYTAADVGQNKCEAAARRLAEVNPHVNITARNLRLNSVEDARSIMAGRDILVCAADRPRIRLYEWLNTAALAERVAWIRGANDGLTVNLFMHVPGATACFECEQIGAAAEHAWYPRFMEYAMHSIGDRTVNPCTAPVAGLIGNLAALEVVKFLTGVSVPVIYNRKLVVDLRTMETRFHPGQRQDACPACSTFQAAPAELAGAPA